MAEKKFTPEQLAAINTTDKTLLVSAAAGSGKTATLTERIIRTITREENPLDINTVLVVTFTNAAAGELRERIGAAVKRAMEKGGSARLERQLRLLPGATICTIDSFCAEILRQNAERVGISPSFRVADEAEAMLISESVLEALINSLYMGERPDIATAEEFSELCDALSDSKNVRRLLEIFEFIYEKLLSTERGVDSLLPLIEIYKDEAELPPEENRFGKYIISSVHEFAAHYKKLLFALRERIPYVSVIPKLNEFVMSDEATLDLILSINTYGRMRAALDAVSFQPKPRIKEDLGKPFEDYLAARELLKTDKKSLVERYFQYTAEEWQPLFLGLHKHFTTFYKVLSEFDRAYADEKRRRGICRYSDIERYAYECLWQDGKPTEVADTLRKKYAAVYIDEYQDVNSLQNKIFEAISRPDNRFMVGDIKQSIYGFRSAKPEIFADMKSSFPHLDEAGDSTSASLFMSKNFRSDEGVISFINSVFDRAFSVFGDSIGYMSSDRLTRGRDAREDYHVPEICLLDKREELAAEDENDEGKRAEPILVARKIKELIKDGKKGDGTPIEPRDVAIILRSVRGHSTAFADALGDEGIDAEIVENKNFFLNSEVLLALCLLNSIDNPRRDVYLAGLMRSPLFNFTADELYIIRKEYPSDTLYTSLSLYCENNPDYLRGVEFLKKLNAYRDIAEGMAAHALISRLYRETGLLSLAAEGERANLILLYEYARKFEGSAYKGLYSFINYINNVINKKARFDAGGGTSSENSVKIVTVHGSKGLEYPVVFYSNTGKTFLDMDKKNRTVYSEDFGIATYLRSSDGLALVKNPVRNVINDKNTRGGFEEELRILYVALTRAKEMLFITGERSKKAEVYDREIEFEALSLDTYSLYNLKSHLAIMLAARPGEYAKICTPEEFVAELPELYSEGGEQHAVQTMGKQKDTDSAPTADDVRDTLLHRFGFVYKNGHICRVPEKMSVSKLYPDLLDEMDEPKEPEAAPDEKQAVPRFIGGTAPEEESAKRGIATHMFLQFCDLTSLEREGAPAELERLRNEGFISGEDAERVRLSEIELFAKSELFRKMRSAKKIYRELRFNIRLPAEKFTKSDETEAQISGKKILVQGVIDCIIEDSSGALTLIDYKTDRLSRAELCNKSLAAAKLNAAHALQLSYYKAAVIKMFGKAPESVEVYSLPLGDTVDINTTEI